jgi:hypothetical protein
MLPGHCRDLFSCPMMLPGHLPVLHRTRSASVAVGKSLSLRRRGLCFGYSFHHARRTLRAYRAGARDWTLVTQQNMEALVSFVRDIHTSLGRSHTLTLVRLLSAIIDGLPGQVCGALTKSSQRTHDFDVCWKLAETAPASSYLARLVHAAPPRQRA